MPSIISTNLNEPPQRKFFNNITSTKTHARHFMSNGINYDKKPSPINNLINSSHSYHPQHRVSLSDNSKFLICCFMWYFTSSLSSNTGKQIMNQFKYPVTLTFIQFLLVACWCAIVESIFKSSTGIKNPTKAIITTMAPLSLFMTVGHIFSSISISRIPVSLVHTIKALAPLFTVLFYRFIFKVNYSSKVYTALIPLTLGVILACSFTFSNNWIGLSCALVSCLIFVMQNIFSKKLLFKESKMGNNNPDKLDKMNMLFYSNLIAFSLMIPLWFYSDASRFLFEETHRDISKTRLLTYFLLNGTTHFAQNWFAFTTLAMSSPVTYSIASLVKRIFVIVMSILWFGQQVSLAQSFGIVLTFIGLWMYQQAKREVDQGETKACEKSLEVLPTSNHVHDEPNHTLGTISLKKWIGNHLPKSNAARETKLL
ncbi:triose-phosphate transporter family-domain-containing protein [Cokeromyces recurvatus]|uniref:triose-phosphate transporter family-domain-containing protein n=1 Tax=Cokeromyces recurvatus TaxID=90255 RepID=UPI00221F8139|nr:triose-phosphate transporter family-domain-containing protein [Cokeromyces recurvatus]KAI7905537.1 triose-phosphate transporter family-domain-containing protein [Cokeromyces recurvatus]